MSALLNNTKNLWRRSVRMKESPVHESESANGQVSEPLKPVKVEPIQVVTIAVVGCGQRGKVRCYTLLTDSITEHEYQSYTKYALTSPEKCKVVAMAEPRPRTRKHFANLHKIDQTLVFDTWQDLLAASAETISTIGKRLADAVLIAVQDHLHAEVTAAFSEQGYHILCEKPMATSIEDCITMENAVKKSGQIFGMGHGMRNVLDLITSSSLKHISSHEVFAVQSRNH